MSIDNVGNYTIIITYNHYCNIPIMVFIRISTFTMNSFFAGEPFRTKDYKNN